MPKLGQVINGDARRLLESVRYMSDEPGVVATMTRSQMALHMDIRERLLKERYGDDWRRHFDREFSVKEPIWYKARNRHEARRRSNGK